MDSPQKRKRLLTDDPNPSTSNEPAPEITKSTDFYFEDGNIVLIAENVAFRVYKGLLAHHSAVFRDMFSVVSQPTDGETFDGCPAVRLSDKSCDVTVLLRSFHGNVRLSLKGFYLLTSVLRMATKYLVDPLRKSCVKSLRKAYPDDLVQWDQYDGERESPQMVVQLIDADILLPAAFYELCSHWPSTLLRNADHKLPPHLWEAHCAGKEYMGARFAEFVITRLSLNQRPTCAQSGPCVSSWDRLEGMALGYLKEPRFIISPDPLNWIKVLLMVQPQFLVCGFCRNSLKTSMLEARSEIWESLPGVFGLGSWKTLRERHNRDFGAM